ncbi:unnamed protein product [Gongylonema pulchrum]|uniref:Secreted protein n=1 Tax=Gongylonema pulchrum TaxID=637853 RepID=A0A183E3D0_9BILA|nr:unnamed protein product [Gongylonema pulchrum]
MRYSWPRTVPHTTNSSTVQAFIVAVQCQQSNTQRRRLFEVVCLRLMCSVFVLVAEALIRFLAAITHC